jgi:hypothetical protein
MTICTTSARQGDRKQNYYLHEYRLEGGSAVKYKCLG